MLKLKDKNGTLLNYRTNNEGAVLTKGKRTIYLIFKSSEQGKKARKLVSELSFNKLFNKGKKMRVFGSDVSYIKFK